MRPIVGYIKPYIPRMGVGIFFKFVGTIMELMIPWILSYILDYVVPQKNTRLVLFWGLLMVLSAIAALVGNILANRISASVARDTTRTLRHDLLKRFLTFPALRSTTSRFHRWKQDLPPTATTSTRSLV